MKHQGFGYVVKDAPLRLLLKGTEYYHSDVQGCQPLTIGPLTVLYNDHII